MDLPPVLPSSPTVDLPPATTTIPDIESSPNPKLRRSKRNRLPNKNVYGGKSGFHSC